MMPEPGVKLLLIATRPYSAMFDGNFVITTLINRPENNFQLIVTVQKVFEFGFILVRIQSKYSKFRHF